MCAVLVVRSVYGRIVEMSAQEVGRSSCVAIKRRRRQSLAVLFGLVYSATSWLGINTSTYADAPGHNDFTTF